MTRISDLKVSPPFTEEKLITAIEKKLGSRPSSYKLAKRSIDARKRGDVHYVCSVDIDIEDNIPHYVEILQSKTKPAERPIIVGSGPAGMMAGLILSRAGLNPVILERGNPADDRMRDIAKLRLSGTLNPNSNVQFGEGGAGTFSDGKLTTGIKDPRCRFILEEYVKHGAPAEILYDSKPHIGTDILINIVQSIRNEITSLGGEYRFGHTLTGLVIKDGKLQQIKVTTASDEYHLSAEHLILAIGHSARDTFELLKESGLNIEQKAFSAGVRIEHLREEIDKIQHGSFAKDLPAADYKLSTHLSNGRGVYTFCMCPGGEIVVASSEPGMLTTNGMSYHSRNSRNSNSALLVNVLPSDFNSNDPLAGVEFQRKLETAAYNAGGGGYIAPAQRLGDFLQGVPSTSFGSVTPSYKPGVTPSNLQDILPDFITASIKLAVPLLDRRLRGFASPDAILTGVETRSSSPIRILRNENYQSNIQGIIPCGEGCGYAGGIMSSAVDGIRCAESIL